MHDFFGLDVADWTFDDRQEVHIGDIDELFNTEPVSPFKNEVRVNAVTFFYLGGKNALLVLEHPSALYWRGVLSVKCLAGEVDVNGYILRAGEHSKRHYLYSLSSHGAPRISSRDFVVDFNDELKNTLRAIGAGSLVETLTASATFAGLLLVSRHELEGFCGLSEKLQETLLPKRRFYSGIQYFEQAEACLNCVFDFPYGNRINGKIHFSEEFEHFIDELVPSAPRLAVCGGKGVGKSTSLRFSVNRLLSVYHSVLFIDFDIGQPEFTVPGCVSVILANEPLLGPSYTHITLPLRSIFLGFVSADLCLERYSQAIKELYDYCQANPELATLPWVINTMGYVKGRGLILLQEILSRFGVSHVLKLHSTDPPDIRSQFSIHMNNNLNFISKTLSLIPPFTTKPRVTPKTCRELMVHFYFENMRHCLKVEKVNLEDRKPEGEFTLIQGDIVACLENGECMGYGIVVSYVPGKELRVLTAFEPNDECAFVSGDLKLGIDFAHNILRKHNCFIKPKSCILLTNGAGSRYASFFSSGLSNNLI